MALPASKENESSTAVAAGKSEKAARSLLGCVHRMHVGGRATDGPSGRLRDPAALLCLGRMHHYAIQIKENTRC